jgi:hypothetical protein
MMGGFIFIYGLGFKRNQDCRGGAHPPLMGWRTRTCGALPDLNNAETIHDFPSRCDEPDRAPFRDGKTYCLPVSQVQQQIGGLP